MKFLSSKTRKAFGVLLFVFVITPLGLITVNPAWGEWEKSYFVKTLGFVPEGIQRASSLIAPLFPDYTVSGGSRIANQYLSAVIGAVIIFAVFYLIRLYFKIKTSGNNDKQN